MNIKRPAIFGPVISCAAMLLMTACSSEVVPPAPVRPTPRPAPAPLQPPPTYPATAPRDWRDAAQTPGNWTYEQRSQGGVARFGSPGSALFTLACNRAGGTMALYRTGSSTVSLPMSIATTSITRALSAEPASAGQPQLVATLRAQDGLLDAMAFSRGRFAVEVNGLPTLYLPAWAEIGRVIEDCRGR